MFNPTSSALTTACLLGALLTLTVVSGAATAQPPLKNGCAQSLQDQADQTRCIEASSTPQLGFLYPLSSHLFVSALGRIGLGTTMPSRKLSLVGDEPDLGLSLNNIHPAGRDWVLFSHAVGSGNPHGSFVIQDKTADAARLTIMPDGHVGVGTFNTPQLLNVGAAEPDVGISLKSALPTGREWVLFSHAAGSGNPAGSFVIQDKTADVARLTILPDGSVGISNNAPQARLDVSGMTRTTQLTITGGSDIAEPFSIVGEGLLPGTVVCIDSRAPGSLRISDGEYDRAVAGVVSGGGGLRPGLVLSQRGVTDEGAPVAMAGRVWCRCDASQAPIAPGDLLTTAERTGHAMRVRDHARAQGAILGKAMSSLSEGQGLVLVLVTLQ